MRRTFALAWRLHRAELAAVVVASTAIALAFLGAATDLAETHRQCQAMVAQVAPCGGPAEVGQYFTDASQSAQVVFPLAAALPFVAGLVLGVPLGSRELEHRTAHLSWPAPASRLMSESRVSLTSRGPSGHDAPSWMPRCARSSSAGSCAAACRS